jgi:hypothetical protein
MTTLNLVTKNKQEEIIKSYLEKVANETLTEKINKGVKTEKDGKTLINKKTLNGFFKYATEEAKKLVEKGSPSAMVEETIVFGWAMHYFEEDSIIGTLYNEDGSECKPVVKRPTKTTSTTTPTYTPPTPKPKPQISFFDLLSSQENKEETTTKEVEEEIDEEDMQDALEELTTKEEKPVSPIYSKYLEVQEKYPNAIITYRLGDFYEVFGENAVKVSNKLDLTLAGRDFGLKERIPMVGFPRHCANDYFNKISDFASLVIIDGSSVTEYLKPTENLSINMETGEILSPNNTNDILSKLLTLFDNNLEIKL